MIWALLGIFSVNSGCSLRYRSNSIPNWLFRFSRILRCTLLVHRAGVAMVSKLTSGISVPKGTKFNFSNPMT